MIPVLDFREALVKRLPALGEEHLKSISRKLAEPRQQFLTQLLTNSFERRHPHSSDSSADAFSRDFLAKGLRTREQYHRFVTPFYDFPQGSWGYSKGRHETKPYRLRKHAKQALWDVYSSEEPVPFHWEDRSGEFVPGSEPTNGMPTSVECYFMVPALLPLPLSSPEHAISRVSGWFAEGQVSPHAPLKQGKPHGATWGDALQILLSARKHIATLGGLPNLYAQQSTGRLGPRSGAFHLIRVPNKVRRLLYEGSGMQDYDIRSCFPSIFLSLGRELGFETKQVEEYLGHKHAFHERWAGMTGTNRDAFKSVVISWFPGATLSPHHHASGARSVGTNAMEIIAHDPVTRALYGEIRQGMNMVLDECGRRATDGKDVVLTNAVGARLRLRRGLRRPGPEAMHLLVGFEQFAIREAARRVPSLQVVVYDGFIAPPVPTQPLTDAIRERSAAELGITLDLELSQEDLSAPLADPETTHGPSERAGPKHEATNPDTSVPLSLVGIC